MPTGIGTILGNGVDLQTFGFFHEKAPGFKDGPEWTSGQLDLPGTLGGIFTDPVSVRARTLQVQGVLMPAAGTEAALVAAEKALVDWLQGGRLRLVFNDGAGYVVAAEGYARLRIAPRNEAPPLNAIVSDVTIEVRCDEGYWRLLEPTIINLAAANTRYPVRLRSGPSTPVLIARGAGSVTNPTFTYRAPDGTPLRTITLTGVNLGSNDRAEVHMPDRMVYKYAAGTRSTIMNNWSGNFPWAFSPRDGAPTLGIYPSIEISEGTGRVIYQEAEG